MTSIRSFYPKPSENRVRYRFGIVIDPLPDTDMILSNRIYEALKAIGVSSTQFAISDPDSVPQWCKAVGIKNIDSTSLLGVWTDKDPETCIQLAALNLLSAILILSPNGVKPSESKTSTAQAC
ncbi:hypothetical protein [Phormidium tenue]